MRYTSLDDVSQGVGWDLVRTWQRVLDVSIETDQEVSKECEGLRNARDTMSGYYINLALVAALLTGLATAMLASTNWLHGLVTQGEDIGMLHPLTLLGVIGACSVGCLLMCITDCIMIDGTLRKLRRPAQLTKYIKTHRTLLGNPWRWLMLGLFFTITEMNFFIRIQFSDEAAVLSSLLSVLMCGAILTRWLEQSKFANTLAEDEDKEANEAALRT